MCNSSEIVVRKVTKTDAAAILYGFRQFYWPHDPLSSGFKIQTITAQQEAFFMSILDAGHSLIATNLSSQDNNEIAGFVTIDIITPESLAKFGDFVRNVPKDERLQALTAIYFALDTKINVFEKYGVDKYCFLCDLAIDPKMYGKRIGRQLVEQGFEVAREQGCKLVVMDCTGCYSERIAKSLGMEFTTEIAYKDYVDGNGEPIFKPLNDIHKRFKQYVKVL